MPKHHELVDLLTRLATGPMADSVGTMSERVALLMADAAAARGQGLRVSDLAHGLALSHAATRIALMRLEAAGLIALLVPGGSHREPLIVITGSGRALIADALSGQPTCD